MNQLPGRARRCGGRGPPWRSSWRAPPLSSFYSKTLVALRELCGKNGGRRVLRGEEIFPGELWGAPRRASKALPARLQMCLHAPRDART
eukprot:8692790-Pyramimonas_sp.AAC.1